MNDIGDLGFAFTPLRTFRFKLKNQKEDFKNFFTSDLFKRWTEFNHRSNGQTSNGSFAKYNLKTVSRKLMYKIEIIYLLIVTIYVQDARSWRYSKNL